MVVSPSRHGEVGSSYPKMSGPREVGTRHLYGEGTWDPPGGHHVCLSFTSRGWTTVDQDDY